MKRLGEVALSSLVLAGLIPVALLSWPLRAVRNGG